MQSRVIAAPHLAVDALGLSSFRTYSAIYLDLRNLNEQITLGVDYLLNKLHQTIEFAYEP